jgi:predicted Rossmann fold nucleotide-binding protein DprA/Smf involved in DNA uptake
MAPPVLFGCGNRRLLDKGGIAVVGSRHASDAEAMFAEELGRRAASSGLSLVSGGARGIDQAAMNGALDNEGTGIGVLPDSLLKAATSPRYRQPLMRGDLMLLSPFNPEAGFFRGNAMGRNKYLYCLADAAIVVCSTPGKGGTWTGAAEALKHAWVPVWVKSDPAEGSGNIDLADRGARWLPQQLPALDSLFCESEDASSDGAACRRQAWSGADESRTRRNTEAAPGVIEASTPIDHNLVSPDDQFMEFLSGMRQISGASPLRDVEIAAQLGLKTPEVRKLLKRAVQEKLVAKLKKPVRYQLENDREVQPSLF